MSVHSLVIDKINVSYHKNQPVIKDVSLTVKGAEIFGLIGVNGSGKTTLIKTILGLRNQDTGSLKVAGNDNQFDDLAYLPERFDPPPFLTGYEFLKYTLDLYGVNLVRKECDVEAESMALDPSALDKPIKKYSKGMRQKLGLMATFLSPANLLILDEPMSGLDPQARVLVKSAIKKSKKAGKTIFFSSHILADMNEICDRVAILHEGCLAYIGKAEDLKKQTGGKNLEQSFMKTIGGKI